VTWNDAPAVGVLRFVLTDVKEVVLQVFAVGAENH
jgi:hypothetical protein